MNCLFNDCSLMHQIQPDSLGDVEDMRTKIGEGVFGKCKKKNVQGTNSGC